MGKWTPDYTDDVLHYKIRRLVSGTIMRSNLEKAEPPITYEEFVNSLDVEDSFTASIIDILVKELAERRTRPNLDDRKFIAERSAKSLQSLATQLRNYRDRPVGRYISHRRSANLTDYLSAPPLEMDMEEDEDIFETMLNDGPVEGARINANLYEAYGTVGPSSRAISSPSPPLEDAPSPGTPQPSHARSGPWSIIANSIPTASLTRQPSIRRPIRSRTVDFSEFTHRRRSNTRGEQSTTRGDTYDFEGVREPWNRHYAARRFFPAPRPRRYVDPADPWAYGPPNTSNDTDGPLLYAPEPPTAPWFNVTPSIHREVATMDEVLADAELSDERGNVFSAPRLRRGGIRAPESILSRHASPAYGTDPPPDTPYELDPVPVVTSENPTTVEPTEPTGYPTPGSTEHEDLA